MVRLEFELAYYDLTVQHFNHDATGTPFSKELSYLTAFMMHIFFFF